MKKYPAIVLGLVLGISVTAFVVKYGISVGQHGSTPVDWNAELLHAQQEIEKNPSSAFWHDQAGVAYDALGNFNNAVQELKRAESLDLDNPIHDYVLYAIYKRRGLREDQRKVLVDALRKDPVNPIGRFEIAQLFQMEGHWLEAFQQYCRTRSIVAGIKGSEYIDPKGNPYDISPVREQINKAVEEASKKSGSDGCAN